jgi:PilZ domain
MNTLFPAPELRTADDRKGRRAKTLRTAKLVYGGFSPTVIDCVVRDLTETGARVETDVLVHLPESFSLQLQGDVHRLARRCWARGNAIGIEFLDEET